MIDNEFYGTILLKIVSMKLHTLYSNNEKREGEHLKKKEITSVFFSNDMKYITTYVIFFCFFFS